MSNYLYSTTLQYSCVLPSFFRWVFRKIMTQRLQPHESAAENGVGLRYSRFQP